VINDLNDAEPLELDDPIPLTASVQVPEFPVGALPAPISAMVNAVAEGTQTDAAMAATSALSVLSACTGGNAMIQIRDGWREPLNIYTVTINAPGERKSAVQNIMVRPVLDVEQELAVKGAGVRVEAETQKQVAEEAAIKARRAAATAAADRATNRDEAMADAIGAVTIAESITVPPIPRIIADDVTAEAAASLVAEQGGKLAIISAEGGIFDIIAGRYNALPNMDLWLKGHSGDPMKVDRKGRPPEYVRHPALTLGLMVQPEVVNTIATNRQFRGRGLLARFLYARPKSKVGSRKIAAPAPSRSVIDTYNTTVAELAAGMAQWGSDPAILMLTDTAHEAMVRLETALEPTLAGDGELAHLADWGSKYAGAVARIAGMLHLATHGAEQGIPTPVAAQTILAAVRIGNYFKACAINAFTEMGADHITADAVYLWGRIVGLGVDEVSERDLQSITRSRFKKKDDLIPAMVRLIEHGYLIPLPKSDPTGGRPASPRYKVWTSAQKTQKTQKG
jgi:hypothetical protein